MSKNDTGEPILHVTCIYWSRAMSTEDVQAWAPRQVPHKFGKKWKKKATKICPFHTKIHSHLPHPQLYPPLLHPHVLHHNLPRPSPSQEGGSIAGWFWHQHLTCCLSSLSHSWSLQELETKIVVHPVGFCSEQPDRATITCKFGEKWKKKATGICPFSQNFTPTSNFTPICSTHIFFTTTCPVLIQFCNITSFYT